MRLGLIIGLILLVSASTARAQKQENASQGRVTTTPTQQEANASTALPANVDELGLQRAQNQERMADFHARRDTLIDFFAQRERTGYMQIAARLYRGEDLDWAQAALDTLMQNPSGDMFWMYPNVLIHYLGKDRLPPPLMTRLRDQWRTYTPYRGDTENHWAMYYASLYLMAQLYPDEPPDSWFNGKSSSENFAEAEDYLTSWMDLTTTRGQGEFDSPRYISYFIIPMAELYAFAEDPEMKQRAGMMLDYILADFAAESLKGLYVGGFSRIYPDDLVRRWDDESTSHAWLLFGNTDFRPSGAAAIVAMSGYVLPEEIYHIARDRSEPYVHRERKRTRHRIRYSPVKNAPVYKYTYMSHDYAMASIQGGLLQPIQQHTWELFWADDDLQEGYNLLFTIHPYSSGHELAMYFPEEPEVLTEAVVKSKGTYDSPDKWTGASPYEQVFQQQDALIALYDIEPGTRFPFISGFFSKKLAQREEHASGWIFSRAGPAFVAYYPLAPYEWREEENVWRLHSESLQNGAVVQAAPTSDYASLDAFRDAVLALPLETALEPAPSVRFTTLRGDRLAFTYGEIPQVDGEPIDRENWPLFDGPFMRAEPGTLTLTYGSMRRFLDFTTVTTLDDVSTGHTGEDR